MAISLLTVTCSRDFKLLERQLTSLNMYLNPKVKHTIILNDDIEFINQIPGAIHCELIPGFKSSKWGGWHSQQALKLQAAHIIDTEHYMVLDSKNYLTGKFDATNYIDVGFREVTDWSGNFARFLNNSYRVFGLDAQMYQDETMWARTPTIMHTATVLGMLEYLSTQGTPISELVDAGHDNQCTEFYLYSAWIAKNKLRNIKWVKGCNLIAF